MTTIDASHAATAVRAAVAEAQDARWREIDAAERVPAKPQRVPARAKAKRSAKAKRRGSLPNGALLLSAREVEALDHLLATHPAMAKK